LPAQQLDELYRRARRSWSSERNTVTAALVGFMLGGLTVSIAAKIEDDGSSSPHGAPATSATTSTRSPSSRHQQADGLDDAGGALRRPSISTVMRATT